MTTLVRLLALSVLLVAQGRAVADDMPSADSAPVAIRSGRFLAKEETTVSAKSEAEIQQRIAKAVDHLRKTLPQMKSSAAKAQTEQTIRDVPRAIRQHYGRPQVTRSLRQIDFRVERGIRSFRSESRDPSPSLSSGLRISVDASGRPPIVLVQNGPQVELRDDRLWDPPPIAPLTGEATTPAESFDAKGRRLCRTEADEFITEPRTGARFPLHYWRVEYDPETGQETRTTHWRVDARTLTLNQPVSPTEFTLPIKANTLVHDMQRQWHYRAETDLTLAAEDGRLDLEQVDGLFRYNPRRAGFSLPKNFGGIFKVVIALGTLGLTVMLAALVWALKHLIERPRLVSPDRTPG